MTTTLLHAGSLVRAKKGKNKDAIGIVIKSDHAEVLVEFKGEWSEWFDREDLIEVQAGKDIALDVLKGIK